VDGSAPGKDAAFTTSFMVYRDLVYVLAPCHSWITRHSEANLRVQIPSGHRQIGSWPCHITAA
jgi:hypothetical protein